MREIKFRAWDKTSQEIIYTRNSIILEDYLDEDIMQYTGLKDKNGTEIYEGDIIEAYGYIQKPKMVVKFNQETTGFEPFISKQLLDYEINTGYFDYEHLCIVIGNIYENPELLDK